MSFRELQDKVALRGGALTLPRGLSKDIDSLLVQSYLNRAPTLSGATSTVDDERRRIVIRGSSDILGQANLSTGATFYLDRGGNPQVVLQYALIGPAAGISSWTFSSTFPDLPGVYGALADFSQAPSSPLDRLELRSAWFVASSQALGQDDPDNPAGAPISFGTNFVGEMTPTELLGLFESLVDGSSSLTLFGTIVDPQGQSRPAALQPLQLPWQLADAPAGISLQATLGVGGALGGLELASDWFRIYSPVSSAWLEQNPTYGPINGFTADLSIPSATITAAISGVVDEGDGALMLRGEFSGVTVDELASLVDLAGTSQLMDHLPGGIRTLGDALGELELESVAVVLGAGAGELSLLGAYFTIGMPAVNWKPIDGFEMDSIAVDFGVNSPLRSPTFFVSVRGQIEVEGVTLDVGASSLNGFTAFVESPSKQTLRLSKLLGDHASGIPAPSDLTIDQFLVTIAPERFYSFALSMADQPNPWVVPVGITRLTISDVTLSFQKAAGQSATGTFGGTTAVGDSPPFSVSYSVPGAFSLFGTFPAFTLADLIATFSDHTIDLPRGFDVTFSQSSLLINKQGQDFVLMLATQIGDLGAVAFELVRASSGQQGSGASGESGSGQSGWGFALGVDLSIGALASIAGLEDLKVFDDTLTFTSQDQLMLAASSVSDPNFVFAAFSSFPNSRIPSGSSLQLPAQARGSFGPGLGAGIFIYGQIEFGGDRGVDLLKRYIGIDAAQLDIALSVGRQPATTARLEATVSGEAKHNNVAMSGGFFAGPSGDGFDLGLFGTLTIGVTQQDKSHHPLDFSFNLAVVPDGLFASGSLDRWDNALGIHGLTLRDLWLELGVDWEGLPTVGISASLDIDAFDGSFAILFDSNQPLNSLVAGAVSDLTLDDVVKVLAGDVVKIPDEIASVLGQIAVRGTDAFSIPGRLAKTLNQQSLSQGLAKQFADHGHELSTNTQDYFLIAGEKDKKWFLTDLRSLTHYELTAKGKDIEVALEAQFYFAANPMGVQTSVTSPTTPPLQPGFRISGQLDVFSLSATVDIEISFHAGIEAAGALSRVDWFGGLFRITDARDRSKGASLSLATFGDPHFRASGEIELLGVSAIQELIDIRKKGIEFDFGVEQDGVKVDLHAEIAGPSSLSAGGDISLGFDIDLPLLGSVFTIDPSWLRLGLDIGVADAKLRVELDGKLDLSRLDIGLGSFAVKADLVVSENTLKKLKGAVRKAVEAIASDVEGAFIRAPAAVFRAVKKGVIAGLDSFEDGVKALWSHGQSDVKEIAKGLMDAGADVDDAARALTKAVGDLSLVDVAEAFKTLDVGADDVARALGKETDASLADIAHALDEGGHSLHVVARALHDGLDAPRSAIAGAFQKLDIGAKDAARAFKDAWDSSSKEITSLLVAGGHSLTVTAQAMKDAFGTDIDKMAKLFKKLGQDGDDVIRALKDAFNESGKRVLSAVKDAGYELEDLGKDALHDIGVAGSAVGNELKNLWDRL